MRLSRGVIELVVTGGALFVSFVLPHEGVDETHLCPWFYLFGIECPFCGMTRAFVAISHLDIGAALNFNVGSPLIYGAFVVVFGRSLFTLKNGDLYNPVPIPENVTKCWALMSIGAFGWMLYIRWIQPYLG
tara:strand:+ start:316 stop:708 length:393 start_codon:yes stop_codon:yes gene_type:complete